MRYPSLPGRAPDIDINPDSVDLFGQTLRRPPDWSAGQWLDLWSVMQVRAEDNEYEEGYRDGQETNNDG